MKRTRWIALPWVPVVLWMGLIFWMSTDTFSAQNTSLFIEPLVRFFLPGIPEHALAAVHGLIRKSAHLAEYFILGVLLFRAFRSGSPASPPLTWALLSLTVVVLFAATDEFHQSFLSTRTASAFDVGLDTVGGFLAQVAAVLRHRSRHRIDKHPSRV